MDNSNYAPLNQSGNTERPKLEPVSTSQKDETLVKKVGSNLIVSDKNTIGSYVVSDILMPSVKDLAYKMLSGALNMAFYGRSSTGNIKSSTFGTSYNSMYSPSWRNQTPYSPSETWNSGSTKLSDILVFPDSVSAQEALDNIGDYLARYHVVSVADIYDMMGRTPAYSAHNWGWRGNDLIGARVRFNPYINRWCLDLPRPEPLR